MKRYLLILTVTAALLLTACAPAATNSSGSGPTTTAPKPTTTASVPTTADPPPTTTIDPPPTTTVPPATTEPINAELEYFNELFRRGQERNPYAYVFGLEFASPKELKLWSFYCGGFAGEHEITDEEWEELSKLLADPVNVAGDFNRLPKDKMEAELQAVFGISLEDMSDCAFSGLFYLESSDCYCFYQSGVHSYRKIGSFLDVKHNDDGTISLSYISNASDADTFVITLKPNGDSYQILSNVKLG